MKFIFLFLVFSIYYQDSGIHLQDSSWRKIRHAAEATLQTKALDFKKMTATGPIGGKPASDVVVFKIFSDSTPSGFVYVSRAMGKYDHFDFAVLFGNDLHILDTIVLVYREEYGGEIASARWLKQFNNQYGKAFSYGSNIQGISGATISGRSMTSGMNQAVEYMKAFTASHKTDQK